jgi:Family of unknown function (DUF5995)
MTQSPIRANITSRSLGVRARSRHADADAGRLTDNVLANLIGNVTTIDDVVKTMRAIDRALPDDDGVKWFNFLYLRVTEGVDSGGHNWQDLPFLQKLDVVFARLYFDALASWERDPAATPHAWRPLLRARHDVRLARLQFALAGMNAHINHDLAIALHHMAEYDDRYPARGSARYADFQRINDLLEQTEAAVRPELSSGLIGELDQALGDLDSILVIWKVRKARHAAWTNGEVLWRLRDAPLLRREYLERLDQMTAFAGQGLLLPTLGASRSV